jgi:cytochrome b
MISLPDESDQLVWDLPTRVFHWGLATSFTAAYMLSESDQLRNLHMMFGYTALGLIGFRLIWGFLGSRHSRFASFAYGPGKALGYLRDLASRRAADCAGHNPAASWAVYLLLTLAAATGVTGWLGHGELGGERLQEAHELLANAWLATVFVHLAGVLVSSLAHGRNLAATMITGRRRGGEGVEGGPRIATGLSVVAAVVAFWVWALAGGGPAPLDRLGLTALAEPAGQDRGHDEDAY